MSYQVLARKWRPQTFDQLKGQQHAVRVLSNSLQNNKLAHAYLFTGTRGVGKTSLARIFAKAINCPNRDEKQNPCLQCHHCKEIESASSLDYREVDGASYNGVDQIRQIIDQIQYTPSSGRYKIFVIDEVHMLSQNAFNALLKTLEEPPAHGLFIFATTDPQKIPETILSRCQRLDLRTVQAQTLKDVLQDIASKEKLDFESEEVINRLVEAAQGSLRDMLSTLEQVRASIGYQGVITLDAVNFSLGLVNQNLAKSIVRSLFEGDVMQLKKFYHQSFHENVDLKKFAQQLHDIFAAVVEKKIQGVAALNHIQLDEAFWVYETFSKDLNWALSSIDPRAVLELILSKIAMRRQLLSSTAGQEESQAEVKKTSQEKKKRPLSLTADQWIEFIRQLRGKKPSTCAALELTQFSKIADDKIELFYRESDQSLVSYLDDAEVAKQLKEDLITYFGWDDEVKLSYTALDQQTQSELAFSSVADLFESERQKQLADRKESIKQNPLVYAAEKIFNVKVDKIHLK